MSRDRRQIELGRRRFMPAEAMGTGCPRRRRFEGPPRGPSPRREREASPEQPGLARAVSIGVRIASRRENLLDLMHRCALSSMRAWSRVEIHPWQKERQMVNERARKILAYIQRYSR